MANANLTFALTASFILGIFLATFPEKIYSLLILLVLGGFLFSALSGTRISFALAIVVAVIVGAVYYQSRIALRNHGLSLPFGKNGSVTGIITEPPSRRDEQIIFSLETLPPEKGIITVLASNIQPLRYGDKLFVQGTIRGAEEAHHDPFMVARHYSIMSRGNGSFVKHVLFNAKRAFIENINAVLPAEEAALAAGLTVGDQNGFTPTLKTAMKESGTTHLVALSGYNIAILVTAIESVMRGRIRKRSLFWFTLIFITFFVIMVGGQASIVRAAIMGMLVLVAKERGRMPSFHTVIVVSAAIMLIHDPRLVRWDLGFQLSFLSLLGIVYVFPALTAWRGRSEDAGFLGWKENLLASIAAQCMVAPLLIQMFETTSMSGIVATVAIITVVPLTMAFGFAIGLIGSVSATMAGVVGWVVHPLLWYQVHCIYFFAKLSIPVWNPLGGWSIVIAYYGALGLFVARYFPRKKFLYPIHEETPTP